MTQIRWIGRIQKEENPVNPPHQRHLRPIGFYSSSQIPIPRSIARL
jgi:hypothetical protein